MVRAPVYDDGTEKTRRSAWIPWATLIARVFGPGSDPMICGRCGLRLAVRAVVEGWDVAKRILDGIARFQRQLVLPGAHAPRDGPAA